MRYLILIGVLCSCTGTLTDEQRKKMKENMALGEIKKVTEAEITDATYSWGRKLAGTIENKDRMLTNQTFLDSLAASEGVEILALHASSQNLRPIEKQLLEAYSNSTGGENVQKMGTDSLLYTKPVFREHPDGSTEFLKAIAIRFTRKQVVLSIK
ncbi:MAG: hypothetical protein E6Q96_04870 [Cyclobacteriaceae bacterium]|nr:MAG: hypothetical protein E6Q96_04870 [Cyclobacteriaceae bacterium]